MSSFICDKCGAEILDSHSGYKTGCEHFPIEKKKMKSVNKLLGALLTLIVLTACTGYAGDLPKPGERLTYNQVLELSRERGWTVDVQLLEKAGPLDKYFVSDGCSGGSPQSWRGVSLYPYCCEHDVGYYAGGSQYDKLLVDTILMLRVAKGTGDIDWAVAMFNGVHLGGNLPAPWQWGDVGVE